ncbi:GNAT family N-acetyltransferase [Marichromatium gracile]|uniref:GNAT family N-acetyltransferase n=1 Tax=Marichromatium gracile TaxID=1048 RepID=UPI001F2ACCFB|nr:GNAT family N-acetyltransferase [Marichromatium gracile]MCF1183494.1 GNAT family N-acetyltransferase [Marichromatium gracile]
MEYSFRPANPEDQAQLFELYQAVMVGYIEKIWGWDSRWQKDDFSEHFDPEQITVVLRESQPIGYVQVERHSDELYIRMLLIAPEHQKKGLGANILKRIISSASKQHLGVKLQVFKINAPARRFYERHGFTVVGETPASLEMAFDA